MSTGFGKTMACAMHAMAMVYAIHAMPLQERTEGISVWSYSEPDSFLTWKSYREEPIFFMKSHGETNPSPDFRIQYFSQNSKNPIEHRLPVKILTEKGEALGLCNLKVRSIVPQNEPMCSSMWVFVPRQQGGFFIKPQHNQAICLNNSYMGYITAEPCREEWSSMGFMYGTPDMRRAFLMLRDLVDMTKENSVKNDLAHILSTGKYMYGQTGHAHAAIEAPPPYTYTALKEDAPPPYEALDEKKEPPPYDELDEKKEPPRKMHYKSYKKRIYRPPHRSKEKKHEFEHALNGKSILDIDYSSVNKMRSFLDTPSPGIGLTRSLRNQSVRKLLRRLRRIQARAHIRFNGSLKNCNYYECV
ncbi:uncharacterized protein NEMAJ01_0254 [Nematocida major]|uniref:uncharacterized protein n=1 Tax=Nematocida major TaxID=1912982 RepID=UPI002007FD68|nr:uncharacterized protein NEMAJ01_0254 [Nematocida major]KAH9385358.1 hypothetical protein NEMAJ01_0254 [Nematocida major]